MLTSRQRIKYAAVAAATGLSSTFPNALITVNLPNLGGGLGIDLAQVLWLPAVFVAFNATANLSIVKARAQFGIPQVTISLLLANAATAALQLEAPGFATAMLTRAVNGLAGAALIAVTIYYLLEVFPGKLRPLALVCGISLTQVGPALARTIPLELLSADHWRGSSLIELAVSLAAFAAILSSPLPPSNREKAFESLDFLTITLAVPAMLLVCGVLSLGRTLWWTDTPWLGWALAAAAPLLIAVFLIEHYRTRPLLQTRWIGTSDILRLALVALLVRVVLAEQTYGSVGLLTLGSLTNDQLRVLFVIVAAAMVLGLVAAILTMSIKRLPYQVLAATLVIAFAAWLDSHATNLSRPPQLYLSQALIGFGTTLFIGPILVGGFLRMLSRGADHFITFVVLFSTSQNLGGLAGSALLGSYQVMAARAHALALSEHLTRLNPQVAARLRAGAGALANVVIDPAARAASGSALLAQSTYREANVLAFNDTFTLVMVLALLTAAYTGYAIARNAVLGRQLTPLGLPT